MKILILDNYDSFTYNLVHILQQIPGVETDVIRNDRITVGEVGKYDKILLSPGPGIPVEAGSMMEIIRAHAPTKSILGVCLGHQGIAEAFGGTLINLKRVMHGVATETLIVQPEETLFRGLPDRFRTGRYHSWVVNRETLPSCFTITALDPDGVIMAMSHKEYRVKGVQFHPESILTENGKKIIENWIEE
jgi:anthranilate synthase component II